MCGRTLKAQMPVPVTIESGLLCEHNADAGGPGASPLELRSPSESAASPPFVGFRLALAAFLRSGGVASKGDDPLLCLVSISISMRGKNGRIGLVPRHRNGKV